MTEPSRLSWTIRFGGLLEAVNGSEIDPTGRAQFLELLEEAKKSGNFVDLDANTEDGVWHDQLVCDCTAMHISDAEGHTLATVPLHQIASVGFVRESPHNFLAVKVGDVVPEAPDLFDVLVLLAPSEEVAEQVCQHFVHCFQFLYREAIAAMEQLQLQEEADLEQLELAKKFVPASSASVSLCSSPISASCQRLAGSPSDDHPPIARCANSTSTSSNSTRQAVELINEYLTMLSACLSHDELNKFAILMRRWRARQMPILEFAQKLLELYGPERRYLLARMRSLLRGDPADLEALSDFLRANGVVENAAAGLGGSPPLTAEMSLGSGEHQAMAGRLLLEPLPINCCLNRSNSSAPAKLAAKRLHTNIEDEVAAVKIGKLSVSASPPPAAGPSSGLEPMSSANNHNPPSGGSSSQRHQKEGGTSFRNFFAKLRKPSEHNNQLSPKPMFFGPRSSSFPSSPLLGASSTSLTADQVQIGSRVYDAQELQKLVPQLEQQLEQKDRQLRQNQLELEAHQKRIGSLEGEVKSLQSECDKLRSVLNQKAESAASPASAATTQKRSEDLHTEMKQKAALLPEAGQPNEPRAKKMAVSAEPAKLDQHKATLQHHSKSAGSKQLIRDAVQKNDFLRQLAKEQVIELVECMFEMRARAGQWVIQEGEPGDRLFVVAEGELQVSREGQALGKMGPGVVMGELAILYNCTRTASVQAISDVVLFCLDRAVFQMITMRLGMERHSQLMNFLRKVSIFQNLNEDRISKMADVMDQDYYAAGHYIIREGEKGDTFFVINSGQVRVTQSIQGEPEPREIRILKQGDFFGEKALLGEEVRTANVIAMAPGVEVLTLDRESFLKLIGDLEALKHRDYGDLQRRATLSARSLGEQPPSPTKAEPAVEDEFTQLQLRQLKRIATLGVGGFGRVELVCINGDKGRTFALKALKKKHIVDTRQQEHIFAERNIMLETRTDWIVRLYKTFRDSKYVYMLLEACLGGELWTTLRDRGHFDDYTARFYVACVLEGLEFLHKRNIVYRDLKPENCLLTTNGYLKLVDFGFAKKLASGRKTWTFCGTPEYVSPEIILNKGHDQAADYWALGIYICELMLGRPPFQASDPMKTYTLILKGIDALEIPNRRIGKTATALVKKLCRDNPAERLGSGSGGVNDIRKHRWFMGFDWEGLRTRTLKPPIIPKVSNPADVSNFDNYPPDQDIPPDEFSGWDEGF